jgi:hypothetical protein
MCFWTDSYTSAIAAFIIMLSGAMALTRMIVDIFPIIDIPVVLVAWNYGGLPAEEMERRVVLVAERSYTQNVDGIEKIESQSIAGTGIIKIYFAPGASIGGAMAQINAVNNQALRVMPPGMTPPILVPFNASSVGVVQMTTSSKTISEQDIVDYTTNFIRLKLYTIPGIALSAPYGGKARQIIVDLDPGRMAAKGVSPNDVVTALQASNVIVPAGVARMGDREYNVAINSSPGAVPQFANLPLVVRNGITVTLGDVAKVGDSFANQTNMVHVNGERASYVTILRHSDASTLAVVEATRAIMPEIKAAAPDGLEIGLDFDQSVFVSAAIENVVHEAVSSSILVSLMILIFLGSWRNMVIVSASIPLSIFAGIAGLLATRQSINLMTLGGLALGAGEAGEQNAPPGRAAIGGLIATRDAIDAEAARGPRVVVASLSKVPDTRTITLLGDAKPYVTATLFAKVNGDLKSVPVDKGELVKAGQIVAEIDSSELESQFQSAIADQDNKQKLAVRARELLRTGSTSQQAAELAETHYRMAVETVRNLGTMRSYQVLRAPFDGTAIARFADPGALMQAATTNQASWTTATSSWCPAASPRRSAKSRSSAIRRSPWPRSHSAAASRRWRWSATMPW